MIVNSLTLWTLIAGVLAFMFKFFAPGFPFSAEQILMFLVFVLGLVNIHPTATARLLALKIKRSIIFTDILKVKAFWVMLVGLVGFVVRFYLPTFPVSDEVLLTVVVFILGFFQITPELRARGLLKS